MGTSAGRGVLERTHMNANTPTAIDVFRMSPARLLNRDHCFLLSWIRAAIVLPTVLAYCMGRRGLSTSPACNVPLVLLARAQLF
jgi:hypothetical protein